MEVKLVVERGGRRRELVVTTPQAVLGRGRGNAIRIPSAEVSRQHCRLRITDGYVEAEDLDTAPSSTVSRSAAGTRSGPATSWRSAPSPSSSSTR
jgi:pSer/pThr/pTyr-binding forkhead associated (FHA) protein